MVAVDLRATVGTRSLGDRRPEVDGYLPSYLRNRKDERSEVAAVVPNSGASSLYYPQAPPLGTAAATSETEPSS